MQNAPRGAFCNTLDLHKLPFAIKIFILSIFIFEWPFLHSFTVLFSYFVAQAETVITADQGVRGGKPIELKKMVDEAVASCPCVKRVFVYSRTGADVPMGPKDIYLDKVVQTF